MNLVLIYIGWILIVSLGTFFIYVADKRSAQRGRWRVPEATLHIWAVLGGWPGAWIAQRMVRHKTRKLSFQIAFYLTIVLHALIVVLIGFLYFKMIEQQT